MKDIQPTVFKVTERIYLDNIFAQQFIEMWTRDDIVNHIDYLRKLKERSIIDFSYTTLSTGSVEIRIDY